MSTIAVGQFVTLKQSSSIMFPQFIHIEPLPPSSLTSLPEKISGLIIDTTIDHNNLPTWLPIVDINQLNDPTIYHHFLLRVMILAELESLIANHLTRGALIAFHSRYKLLLLAHSQPKYRSLGPFVAGIESHPLQLFSIQYKQLLMDLLATPATIENHTNVLSHIQGYFRPQLEAKKRQALADLIQDFRNNMVPLSVPINQIIIYMKTYPHPYLQQQQYFNFYPDIQDNIK